MCRVKPDTGTISAQNPEYRFQTLISEWTPLNAGVGELSTAQVQWPISGPITKDITP